MSGDTVEDKCWRAFENGEKEKVMRLLPAVVNPRELKVRNEQTILHWACYHGWIDIVMKLIHEYQFDLRCRDNDDNTLLHFACSQKGNLHIVQYLINKCRCDPMSKNRLDDTPIHEACSCGDIEMVRFLINKCQCDPTSKNKLDDTPLHEACKCGDIETVRYLIGECRCDPMSESKNANTPLHEACKHGDIEMVRYLIGECGCDPMSESRNGNTPLHEACKHGDIEIVRYLIGECRCDPMSESKNGNTPLHFACSQKGNLLIIQHLINKCRCNPMKKNTSDDTPLHEACRCGDIEMVRYLICECRCDPMSKSKSGNTPLHIACRDRHIEMVRYLISECRCEVMSRNNGGDTPLHVACSYGHIEMVRYLIAECQCDPMCKNNNDNTLLHITCTNRDIKMVRCLISEFQCDPMCKNIGGDTPLHVACRMRQNIEMVRYLISECHCDLMIKNNTDNTPLHLACYVGHSIDVIEYILSTGKIDPLAKNIFGKTPLQMVGESKREKVKQSFATFGKIEISYPVNSYVNVVLLGNPGAGKSTLAQVIIQRASSVFASIRGLFQYVKGVELHTAGIIPSKLEHRELGNVILHDLAGQPEYYSSHIAVLENLLHGSAAVFIIVVSLFDKEVYKHLQQWLTIVENECQKALRQCYVITVASHIDEVDQSNLPIIYRQLAEISSSRLSQQCIVNCGLVHLDCRKLVGGKLSSFTATLSSACQYIRSTNTREMSLYCHMLYALLEEKKESVYTLDQLMAILRKSDEYCLPNNAEEIIELLSSLHTTGLIVFLKNNHTPGNSWVVARKRVLLTEVNGVLFAPDNFKEHRDIASNTGIISLSSLSQLFPQYSSDMLVVFLQYMELCQEISPDFLTFTNLMIKEEESSDETEKRLLFFPALMRDSERPKLIRETFQFGWCLQCSNPHQFFVPRFLHVLLLHLAYYYALPIIAHSQSSIPNLHRLCDIWKNGIHWLDTDGVETAVELVDNSQCVVLLMSCKQDLEHNMIEHRREIITEIISLQKRVCRSLEVEEFVIDPDDLKYPIIKPSEQTLYNMKLINLCILQQKPCVLDSKGHKHRSIQELLPFKPSDNIHSGSDPKVSYSNFV